MVGTHLNSITALFVLRCVSLQHKLKGWMKLESGGRLCNPFTILSNFIVLLAHAEVARYS